MIFGYLGRLIFGGGSASVVPVDLRGIAIDGFFGEGYATNSPIFEGAAVYGNISEGLGFSGFVSNKVAFNQTFGTGNSETQFLTRDCAVNNVFLFGESAVSKLSQGETKVQRFEDFTPINSKFGRGVAV